MAQRSAYADGDYPRSPGNYVYALCDPSTGETRYIGKTTGRLAVRVRNHVAEAVKGRRTHKAAWIRLVVRRGGRLRMAVLSILSDPDDLPASERWWIAAYSAAGVRLTNMTGGGEGMWNPTPETRVKLRARTVVGSSAQREAARESMRRLWADPEFRAKRLERRVVRPPRMTGEELREFQVANATRMGKMNAGRVRTPEHRARLGESVRRAYAEGRVRPRPPVSDEARANMRAGQARRRGR